MGCDTQFDAPAAPKTQEAQLLSAILTELQKLNYEIRSLQDMVRGVWRPR